jgi:hypothetical protein
MYLGVIEHYKNYIRFTIIGYELLQQHVFFAWSTFLEHNIAEPIENDPHPPCSRVDPPCSRVDPP